MILSFWLTCLAACCATACLHASSLHQNMTMVAARLVCLPSTAFNFMENTVCGSQPIAMLRFPSTERFVGLDDCMCKYMC